MATQPFPTLDATIPTGSGIRWLIADTLTIARRNIIHIRRVPEKLINVTIQPILFVLLFRLRLWQRDSDSGRRQLPGISDGRHLHADDRRDLYDDRGWRHRGYVEGDH